MTTTHDPRDISAAEDLAHRLAVLSSRSDQLLAHLDVTVDVRDEPMGLLQRLSFRRSALGRALSR